MQHVYFILFICRNKTNSHCYSVRCYDDDKLHYRPVPGAAVVAVPPAVVAPAVIVPAAVKTLLIINAYD